MRAASEEAAVPRAAGHYGELMITTMLVLVHCQCKHDDGTFAPSVLLLHSHPRTYGQLVNRLMA